MGKIFEKCKLCGKENSTTLRMCKVCRKNHYKRLTQDEKGVMVKRAYYFVERIEKRNGMISTHELFVELITLYDECEGNHKLIDKKPVYEQLKFMYEYLKKFSKWKKVTFLT